MDLDGKISITSTDASPVHSNCATPEVTPSENHSSSLGSQDNVSPRNGSVIPNRIFVGGFDYKMTERDLWFIFSHYGTVIQANIVKNSSFTKGYGFVTFKNPEDARKLLLNLNGIYFENRRLNIHQAVRKQHVSRISLRHIFSVEPVPMPCGTVYQTTSGLPYTFHKGVAYFYSHQASLSPHEWTPQPVPVMEPQPYQPVYHQSACHHYQSPVSSGPVMYTPEYCQHVPDGAIAYQPPMDNSNESHMYSSFPMPPPPPPPAEAACFFSRELFYPPDLTDPELNSPQAVLQ